MMSCGMSRRYGSSLLLKTADFSIQGVTAFRAVRDSLPLRSGEGVVEDGLLCGFLTRKCRFDFLGPDVAHLHHVAEAQTARILGRLLVGQLLERCFQGRVLFVEAGRLG